MPDEELDQLTKQLLEAAREEALAEVEGVPNRFVAVAMGAVIESKLDELLTDRFCEGAFKEIHKKTYSERVRLCYAVGIIDSETREALLQFGNVRNHFAHRPDAQFTDKDVLKQLHKFVDSTVHKVHSLEPYRAMSENDFKKKWKAAVERDADQAVWLLKLIYQNAMVLFAAAGVINKRIKSMWP